MNPKPVAAGFVTTHHRYRWGELQPTPRLTDRMLHPRPVTARHRPHQRRVPPSGCQRQLPFLLAQLERDVQRRLAYTLLRADRCDHHSLLLVSNSRTSLTATVRSHSLSVVSF